MPIYDWDDSKRLSNLTKHGIDFEDAWIVLEGQHFAWNGHPGGDGEVRRLAVGLLDGLCVTVVHAMRGEVIRIISKRRSDRKEREAFHGAIHDG